MTAYGGLLPVATMLEKLQFQQLIEEHVTINRVTSSMPGFRFVLAQLLGAIAAVRLARWLWPMQSDRGTDKRPSSASSAT